MATSKERLIKLIDRNNPLKPLPFSSDNISFKNPVPDLGQHWNTKVTVVGIRGHGYKNEADVYYTRVPLNEISDSLVLYSDTEFTADQILQELNFVKGTTVDYEDLLPFTVPVLSYDELQLFSLTASPLSLAWIGKVDVRVGKIVGDDIINPLHYFLHVTVPAMEANYTD